jgi:hypothetical protein
MESPLTVAIAFFAATVIVSTAISIAAIVGLPNDYFADIKRTTAPVRRTLLRSITVALKNVCGAMLILAGAVLSLPGIPGQGLLTIFAGLLLLDFPGKPDILKRILRRRSLLRTVNQIRSAFSQPPLRVESSSHSHEKIPAKDHHA